MQRDQGVQGRLFGADEEGTAPGAGASPTPPAGGDATRELGELTQPEGEVAFDGQHTYTYTGYVLEGARYVQKRFRSNRD